MPLVRQTPNKKQCPSFFGVEKITAAGGPRPVVLVQRFSKRESPGTPQESLK